MRNVIASERATLVRGGKRDIIRLHSVSDETKPEILKAYLDNYKLTVQRYFPIPAGSPAEHFKPLAGRYPVFEITPDP
jgi:hypothetical protein